MAEENGRDAVALDRCRLAILAKSDILQDDWVDSGVIKLLEVSLSFSSRCLEE